MLRQISWGFVVGFALVLGLAKCAGGSALIACRVDAVKILPSDPDMVSAYDVVDLVGRLRACSQGDAGGR